MPYLTKKTVAVFAALLFVISFTGFQPLASNRPLFSGGQKSSSTSSTQSSLFGKGSFRWEDVPQRYPATSHIPLPTPGTHSIPQIQHDFVTESPERKKVNRGRVEAVRSAFKHAWRGYKNHAWLKDEVKPITGGTFDAFGGWAATLVDTLGFLWIMEMKDEFEEAVEALEKIDFTDCTLDEINVFETTIRYMGGFLSANDLSGGQYPGLLKKAMELGEMLYHTFDTPNGMPMLRWSPSKAKNGEEQQAAQSVIVAEIGSLTLEFTRLTQITGDARYYSAVANIMNKFDEQQALTKLPGLFPVLVDAQNADFKNHDMFTIGGMVDSLYEYFPKEHILLGGASTQYRKLYADALKTMQTYLFYRPMVPDESQEILYPGQLVVPPNAALDELEIDTQAQHLACFVGGMVAVGSRVFGNKDELSDAKKLAEGCLWGYEAMPNGIMPEIMHLTPCQNRERCPFYDEKWRRKVDSLNAGASIDQKIEAFHLPKGVSKVDDTRYILRPEAIESVFYLYRITGDPSYQDRAWGMFQSIVNATRTDIANAAMDDCMATPPVLQDRMESFWLAETLKYFFLIFSDPDVISLDEWVLSTEAHPLKRPSKHSG